MLDTCIRKLASNALSTFQCGNTLYANMVYVHRKKVGCKDSNLLKPLLKSAALPLEDLALPCLLD